MTFNWVLLHAVVRERAATSLFLFRARGEEEEEEEGKKGTSRIRILTLDESVLDRSERLTVCC